MPLNLTPGLQWWQLAQQKGLVAVTDDASNDFDPSRIPMQFCGVSLSYLEDLASTLVHIQQERSGLLENSSTTCLMKQLVCPALVATGNASQRLWDHVPPQHTGRPQWSVTYRY